MKVSDSNTQIVKLTVDIRPGPAPPAQKAAWRKFWARLIGEAMLYRLEYQRLKAALGIFIPDDEEVENEA